MAGKKQPLRVNEPRFTVLSALDTMGGYSNCEEVMPRLPVDKKRILTRVRRIRGQVEALERALEQDVACDAILQQIAAVRGAANGLMGDMVEVHLKDELVNDATTPEQRAAKMAEIGPILRAYLK